MKKTKVKTNSKGITLIALVVTIVVLLILAGISINLVLGNNGIIAKAQDAEVGTRAGRLEDEIELWKADAYIADNANGTIETEQEMLARLVRDKLITQDDEVDETNKIIRVKKKDKQTIVKEISYAYKTSTITENIFEYTPEGIITGIKEKYLIGRGPKTATDEKRTIKMASINNKPIKLAAAEAAPIYFVEKLNEEITIPKEIEGTKIVGIGDGAFGLIENLKKVTIKAEIASIGDSAFYRCISLTNITIPDSVTSIRDGAFERCTSLTNITIPDGIKSIADGVFSSCEKLDNITIPTSVTSIGAYAFSGCESLTNIIIPNTIISIGNKAFWFCKNLTNITIPNSVTSIGEGVFANCSLSSIIVEENNPTYDSRDNCNAIIETNSNKLIAGCHETIIPNSVISIENLAFRGLDYLTNITIPSNVISIGDEAFSFCENLTNITILNGVTKIGNSTFLGCKKLTDVIIPNSVVSIGNEAFQQCWIGLTNITIPNSVINMGREVFAGCSALQTINVPFKEGEIPEGWDNQWREYCSAQINYMQ